MQNVFAIAYNVVFNVTWTNIFQLSTGDLEQMLCLEREEADRSWFVFLSNLKDRRPEEK